MRWWRKLLREFARELSDHSYARIFERNMRTDIDDIAQAVVESPYQHRSHKSRYTTNTNGQVRQ